jgi:hypothetical protein
MRSIRHLAAAAELDKMLLRNHAGWFATSGLAVDVDGGVSAAMEGASGARRCEGRIWRCCRKFVVSRVRDSGVCTEGHAHLHGSASLGATNNSSAGRIRRGAAVVFLVQRSASPVSIAHAVQSNVYTLLWHADQHLLCHVFLETLSQQAPDSC